MRFETRGGVPFEIPDEWWQFPEMDTFTLRGGRFYPYQSLPGDQKIDAIPLADVEPPMRNCGVPPFKKYHGAHRLRFYLAGVCASARRSRCFDGVGRVPVQSP